MPSETIKDFLVAIGYKVDEASQRKFIGGLEETIVKANLVSTALEDLARSAASNIGKVAENFEQLYYASQRTGATVQGINAFKYAASQLGSTADAAGESLVTFGKWLQINPVAKQFVESTLGVRTAINGVARDTADVLADVGKSLAKQPLWQQENFRKIFLGVDFNTMRATMNAQWDQFFSQEKQRQRTFGIDDKMVADAVKNARSIRDAWQTLDDAITAGAGKIGEVIQKPLSDLATWFTAHGSDLDKAMDNVGTSVKGMIAAISSPSNIQPLLNDLNGLVDVLNRLVTLETKLPVIMDIPKKLDEAKDKWARDKEGNIIVDPGQDSFWQGIKNWFFGISPAKAGDLPASLPGAVALAEAGSTEANAGTWGQPRRGSAPPGIRRRASEGTFGGSHSQIDGLAPTVNGIPVSSGNPLPVTISSDSGGFWDGLKNALGLGPTGLIGGALGGGGRAGGMGAFAGEKSVGGWWTPARMKYASDRLMKEAGLSEMGAAGLVARWAAVEAPGGPGSQNDIGGGHYGIAQWGGDRRPAGPESFEDQVSRAVRELKGREMKAAATLRSATTATQAAQGAAQFERAEGWTGQTDAFASATPVDKVLAKIRGATGSVLTQPPKSVFPDTSTWPKDKWGTPITPRGWMPDAPLVDPNATSSSSGGDTTNNATAHVTNNVTVNAPDPHSAAAMVGLHLDRSGNDIARNLQGAFQ